jgi:hypothetical protein
MDRSEAPAVQEPFVNEKYARSTIGTELTSDRCIRRCGVIRRTILVARRLAEIGCTILRLRVGDY